MSSWGYVIAGYALTGAVWVGYLRATRPGRGGRR